MSFAFLEPENHAGDEDREKEQTGERDPERSERAEERRKAIIIFADIAGFTTFSQAVDPDVLRSLVDQLMKSFAAAVEEQALAHLEVQAPRGKTFVLHGTLPLPPGVYPRADGQEPFGIVSRGRLKPVIPAQVEVVSRHPNGDADVVEVIARVALDPRDRPGSHVRFALVSAPHERREPFPTNEVVARLLEPEPGAGPYLRTRDELTTRLKRFFQDPEE